MSKDIKVEALFEECWGEALIGMKKANKQLEGMQRFTGEATIMFVEQTKEMYKAFFMQGYDLGKESE